MDDLDDKSDCAEPHHSVDLYPCWSFFGLLAGFFLSALFYVPPSISLPAVVVALATACFCAGVFYFCPAKPHWAKLLAGALMLASFSMAVHLVVTYF